MISYAIDLAKSSKLFDRIIVSTDDEKIAEIARHYGADVPFIRPPDISGDNSTTLSVLAHAVAQCEGFGWFDDVICCIYPSVPLISCQDLRESLFYLEKSHAPYVFPVNVYPHPVQRALRVGVSGYVSPFYPEFEGTPTQELEPAYHDSGQFYWGKRDAWVNGVSIHDGGFGYEIPYWRTVDIDTEDDWVRAEILFDLIKKRREIEQGV